MKFNLKHNANKAKRLMGYSFSMPAVIFLSFFIVVSILYCFYMSFFEWKLFDMGANKVFVGLANYAKLFHDEVFGIVLKNTLLITACCLVLETLLGFAIALALWAWQRKLRVVQTIFLLPMITSPVIVALIWRYIYDPQFGILNYFLHSVFGTGNIAWLGDAKLALPSIILVDVWQMTPFTILMLYAAMMNINDEWIEAAQIDGASFFKTVKKIVIPSILPMTSFILLMRTMDLLKIFDTIYVLTRGGPGYATETMAMYTYKVGFSQYDMGYAMALSIATLVVVLLLSIPYIRRQKR